MGWLGGPDPVILLTDEVQCPIPQDATPERLSMVSRSFSSLPRLMTNAKILDLKGNELVKPPFFYGDAIVDDVVTMMVEERHWLRKI